MSTGVDDVGGDAFLRRDRHRVEGFFPCWDLVDLKWVAFGSEAAGVSIWYVARVITVE